MILTEIQQNITLPSCTLHKCGLQIDQAATEEDLAAIGLTLNAIGQCGLWWWGDYLNGIERRKGEKFTEALAESSYAYSSLRNAKWVTGKIDLSMRIDKLSFNHHQEALSECDGDAQKAMEWLAAAAKGEWSISELRKRIRISKMGYDNSNEKAEHSIYDEVKEMKRWFRSSLDNAQPALLTQLRTDLVEMVEAIDRKLPAVTA